MDIERIWRTGTDEEVINLLDRGFVPQSDVIVGYCSSGNVKMVTKLLRHPANTTDGFISAVRHGYIDVLDQLYVAGLDVNLRMDNEETILHFYVENDQTLRWLLNRGCNPNASDAQLNTPLHNLVYSHPDLDMITTLFNFGAAQLPNEDGNTPLHLACNQGDVELVTKLVKNGPIQAKSTAGWTPLHYSCNRGFVEVTNILLRKGAIETCDNKGRLPSDLLRKYQESL